MSGPPCNRRSGHELQEVAEVVRQLRHHPLLAHEPRRHRWAAHVMQFQLCNLLKQLRGLEAGERRAKLHAIHTSAGLRRSVLALMHSAPQRLRGFLNLAG